MYSRLLILLLLSTLTYSSLFATYNIVVHPAQSPSVVVLPAPQKSKIVLSDRVKGAEVSLFAFVGSGHSFTPYGYTSPGAQVILEGQGITAETTSRADGYYSFDNTFSPIISQEICISSIDTVGRLSNQVCLPPLPINYNANIGPIILSPSISVDNGDVFIGQHVILTGKTIPNTPVVFSFFKDEKKSPFTSFLQQIVPLLPSSVQRRLVSMTSNNCLKVGVTSSEGLPNGATCEAWEKERVTESALKKSNFLVMTHNHLFSDVQAFTFPELKTVSDKDGNYSIGLPTSTQSFLRTFTQVEYQNAPSEKSRTLNIKILPFWSILLTFISIFFKTIFGHIIATTFVLEIIVLLFYLKNHFFHPYRLARGKTTHETDSVINKS